MEKHGITINDRRKKFKEIRYGRIIGKERKRIEQMTSATKFKVIIAENTKGRNLNYKVKIRNNWELLAE